jgi:8-oxo-dGTP diphosphatase
MGCVEPLRVIAAAVVVGGRLLLVSKRAAPGVFYLPGGKPEPREAPLACVLREVREELGCLLHEPELFLEVDARAALEGVEMHMTVYRAGLVGTPMAATEIAALTWWPEEPVTLAPAVELHVIPALQRDGLLPACSVDYRAPMRFCA